MLVVAAFECRSETGTVLTQRDVRQQADELDRARRVRARGDGHPDGRLQPAARHRRRSAPAQFGLALAAAVLLLGCGRLGKLIVAGGRLNRRRPCRRSPRAEPRGRADLGGPMRIARSLPGVRALAGYRISWLRHDVVAGLVLSRCSCRRAWPTPSSPGCRRSPASTRRSLACSATRVFGPSRVLVLGPDSSVSPLIFATIAPAARRGGRPGARDRAGRDARAAGRA